MHGALDMPQSYHEFTSNKMRPVPSRSIVIRTSMTSLFPYKAVNI